MKIWFVLYSDNTLEEESIGLANEERDIEEEEVTMALYEKFSNTSIVVH